MSELKNYNEQLLKTFGHLIKAKIPEQELVWEEPSQCVTFDFVHEGWGCGYFILRADGTWDCILPD